MSRPDGRLLHAPRSRVHSPRFRHADRPPAWHRSPPRSVGSRGRPARGEVRRHRPGPVRLRPITGLCRRGAPTRWRTPATTSPISSPSGASRSRTSSATRWAERYRWSSARVAWSRRSRRSARPASSGMSGRLQALIPLFLLRITALVTPKPVIRFLRSGTGVAASSGGRCTPIRNAMTPRRRTATPWR